MKKIISISAFVLAAVAIVFAASSQGKLKPYYSGDAIAYQGKVIAATANTGSLEVFSLEGQKMKLAIQESVYNRFGAKEKFYDVKLSEENGKLYAYAVSNYTLYRYDISDLKQAQLDKKVSNTYWEWYNRVDRFGDKIVTVSAKAVRIWNSNLEIIDAFKIDSSSPYGVRGESSSRYIVSLSGNTISIYDRSSRSELTAFPVNFKNIENGHRPEFEAATGKIYLADDYYLKAFDLDGNLLSKYSHAGNVVYDTETLDNSQYVYFSNGFGIYRTLKSDLSKASFTNTISIAGAGSWAMGIKAVRLGGVDHLVVFNNNAITVIDGNMKKEGQYQAVEITEEVRTQAPKESLYFSLAKYWGMPGEKVSLAGGGFLPGESLTISLEKNKVSAQADSQGRFVTEIIVPEYIESGRRVDIKAVGDVSGLSYSSSFDVK